MSKQVTFEYNIWRMFSFMREFLCTEASSLVSFFFLIFIFTLFYFTILYWFCHTLTWIHHRCTWVPKHEPPFHLTPHIISLDHPRAPAPSILYHASNIDWRFVSYMIVYMFQCHSPRDNFLNQEIKILTLKKKKKKKECQGLGNMRVLLNRVIRQFLKWYSLSKDLRM